MKRSIKDKEFYIKPPEMEEEEQYGYYHYKKEKLQEKLLESGVMKEGDILYVEPFTGDYKILRKENIMCAQSFNDYLKRKEEENENNE